MPKAPAASSDALKTIKRWQKRVVWLLYIAMVLKMIGAFVPMFNFPAGLVLFAFFAAEIFLLPPLGMAFMVVIGSVLFFLLPFIAQIIVGTVVASVALSVVGIAVSMALSGIIVYTVGGAVVAVEAVVITAPMTIALGIGGASVGLGFAMGAGAAGTAVGASKMASKRRAGRFVTSVLASLLIFAALGWPCLSFAGGLTGIAACKPAVLARKLVYNHFNIGSDKYLRELFSDGDTEYFVQGFYDDVIVHNRSNMISGDKTLFAAEGDNSAILLDGTLYARGEGRDTLYYAAAYLPRREDAMVMWRGYTIIFGHNKIFCAGHDGSYTWKDTKWTSEFTSLTREEQFERLYDILERQNTDGQALFTFEDAAVVAYAQRNGLLLDYDGGTRTAYFALRDKSGRVTVYLQTAPNERREAASFTPDWPGNGLPYLMVRGRGVFYLSGDEVRLLGIDDWQTDKVFFHNPEKDGRARPLRAIAYVGPEYLDEDGDQYLLYTDGETEFLIDPGLMGDLQVHEYSMDCEGFRALCSVGDTAYLFHYPQTIVSRLTFLHDVRETSDNWMGGGVWREALLFLHLDLHREDYDPEFAEAQRTPDRLYPAPELSPRRGGMERYDRNYLSSATYGTYQGPAEDFRFGYPERTYDDVDYFISGDGADVEIRFTCADDPGALEAALHPLPEGAGSPLEYGKSLYDSELSALYNGAEIKALEGEDGSYRFRLEGWADDAGSIKRYVIVKVDAGHVMRLVLDVPASLDRELMTYYANKINYLCGFGIPSSAPKL